MGQSAHLVNNVLPALYHVWPEERSHRAEPFMLDIHPLVGIEEGLGIVELLDGSDGYFRA